MTRARDLAAFVSNADGDIKFDTDTLFIDSSTNRVGILNTTPSHALDVTQTGATSARVGGTGGSGANDGTVIINNGGTGDAMLRFDYENNTDRARIGTSTSSQQLEFYTAGDNERMRIDSSGNLLVGHNDPFSPITNGGSGVSAMANGQLFCGMAGTPFYVNREDSDGNIAVFRKDGTAVGSIGNAGSNLFINSAGAGGYGRLQTEGTERLIWYASALYPSNDNNYDLGISSNRYDDVFATNGTIQTSDENEKQQIASLTDAEITAAKAISKLFKTFKWNDKVEAKGDAARTHTGVIAQQVETAMSDAGLDAGNYAFFISTTWWEADETYTDDDGVEQTRTNTYNTLEEAPEGATERNRKGIRYPELLSFIGAATEQRLTSIEARLDALEA